jgi:hypothetical protein
VAGRAVRVSTERIVDAAATMLETWAANLRVSASLCQDAIADGDPDGLGIDRLQGRSEAYSDVAKALQASADDVRGRVQSVAKPRLRAVPSTSKERDH